MSERTSFGVVVPVKLLAVAKSRLAVDPALRRALALAMAVDTVTAALSCSAVAEVLVVTDDPLAAPALRALGATVTSDEPDAGLNAALAHGAEHLRRRHPHRGVATLGSDLPALTPAVLGAALARVTARAVVADLAGTGTTLLAAADGHELAPAYGPDSLVAHVRSGAALLEDVDDRLRRDVDTLDDLAAAAVLGLGPATLSVRPSGPR